MKYQAILLPTNQPTRLFLNDSDELCIPIENGYPYGYQASRRIIIVSDEQIYARDYVWHPEYTNDNGSGSVLEKIYRCKQVELLVDINDNSYISCDGNRLCKKVIASTDKLLKVVSFIDKEECMKLINYYNQHGKMSEIELEKEINQCDGCCAGLPVENGIHRDHHDFGMVCTKPNNSVIIKVIESIHKCIDCGCPIDEAYAKIFTCCDNCWDKSYHKNEENKTSISSAFFTSPIKAEDCKLYTKEEVIKIALKAFGKGTDMALGVRHKGERSVFYFDDWIKDNL